MDITPSFVALADGELLDTIRQLAACERSATVALVAALAEVDSTSCGTRRTCFAMSSREREEERGKRCAS